MPAEPAPSAPRPAKSFAALARRISGWTANLLATAIVLVAGLVIGRQVIDWWRVEGTVRVPPASVPDSLPDELRLLTTRGPLEIARVSGDRFAALDRLRRVCKELGGGAFSASDAGPGETQFLTRLAQERPVEQTEDLDLYEPRGELTMVVAVSRPKRRIAAWGFALPTDEAAWSCYTFSPAGGGLKAGR